MFNSRKKMMTKSINDSNTIQSYALSGVGVQPVELYVAILVFFSIVRCANPQIEEALKWPIVVLGGILLLYCSWNYYIERKIIIAMALYTALNAINFVVNGIYNTQTLAMTIAVYFPIALFFLYNSHKTFWFWNFFFILVITFLFYKMTKSPDGYLLYYATSRNYVSVYSLIVLSFAAFAAYSNGKQLSIILPLITFILALYSIGRGGIITTAFLFVSILIYRGLINNEAGVIDLKGILLISGILVLIIVAIINYEEIVQKLFSRFVDNAAKGSNNERADLLRTYVEHIPSAPILKVIFGMQPNGLPNAFVRVGWNIHNSYLQFYANTGIIGITSLIVLICNSISYLYRRRVEELIIFVAFLLRCGTDYVFSGNVGDMVLLYFLFLPWVEKTNTCSKKHF